MTRDHSAVARRALLSATVGGFVLALVVEVTGGFGFSYAGIRVASHDPWRPALLAAVAALAAWAVWPQATARDMAGWWTTLERLSPWIAAAAASTACGVGLVWGTFTASGADAYGYVSQAALWAQGGVHVPQPLALDVGWRDPEWTFSPLGYRPATYPGAIVPTYAAGLPLLMAGALKIGGPSAVFLVAPALGALAVACAYAIGRAVEGPITGMMSAVLLAASPVFLLHLMQPMSDVPAAAWWLASFAAVLQRYRSSPLMCGLLVSLAVLTRPNLLPLVLPLAVFLGIRAARSGGRRELVATMALFGIGLMPGIALTGWINHALYGSPLRSGYGAVDEIYQWRFFKRNVRLYPTWAIETQTPFVVLALAAPFVLRRSGTTAANRGLAGFFLAWTAALFLCYAFYFPFETWSYLRFLIPGIALLLALSAAVVIRGIRALPLPAQAPAAAVLTAVLVAVFVRTAVDRRVFDTSADEQRYTQVARFVERALPTNAVFFSMQHSGSLRHYAGRQTVRWDFLDREYLDTAASTLVGKGYVPYLALEAWEEPGFRKRYARWSLLGRLDWPPRADIGGRVRVRIYDLADRARYVAGESVSSERVP